MSIEDEDTEVTDVILDQPADAGDTGDDKDKSDEKPDEPDASDGDAKTDDKPKAKGFQKRINKITKRNAGLKRDNEDLRKENERLKTKDDVQETDVPKPKEADYDTYAEFQEALTDWKLDERDAKRDAKTKKSSEENARETEHAEVEENYLELADEFREDHEDFDEVTLSESLAVTTMMAEALMGSELGPDILYHLGKNPKEARRISSLTPISQIREIGKIEAKLSKPVKKTRTGAPKPVDGLGSNNDASSGPSDKDDIGSWIKKRQKQVHGS